MTYTSSVTSTRSRSSDLYVPPCGCPDLGAGAGDHPVVSRVLSLSQPIGQRTSWHVRAELLDGNGDVVRTRQCLSAAVAAAVSGDVVVLHAASIRTPSASLLTFLLDAARAVRSHGASLRIEPVDCALVDALRAEGLYDDVVGSAPSAAGPTGLVPRPR
ncbi:hypothetical protein [Motilibacter aurantiacus]|uniref:hypothetical protein n=1 Tax=Motilibacter aurantiacus TaxID=2714955 RepID=UPI0014097382|nr:hypothetical protein [Motilibacter aurantiacus]NHC43983.1 hypothetical protein [Motilibacter aurantiacus]